MNNGNRRGISEKLLISVKNYGRIRGWCYGYPQLYPIILLANGAKDTIFTLDTGNTHTILSESSQIFIVRVIDDFHHLFRF